MKFPNSPTFISKNPIHLDEQGKMRFHRCLALGTHHSFDFRYAPSDSSTESESSVAVFCLRSLVGNPCKAASSDMMSTGINSLCGVPLLPRKGMRRDAIELLLLGVSGARVLPDDP